MVEGIMIFGAETNASDIAAGALSVLFFGAVLGLAVLYTRSKQRKAEAHGHEIEATAAAQLGGTFHDTDTDRLHELPFVAFRTWPNVGFATITNVITTTGPFGYALHTFELSYQRVRDPSALQGATAIVATDRDLHRTAYRKLGVLVGLPRVVPTVVVSSDPDGTNRGVAGGGILQGVQGPVLAATDPMARFQIIGDAASTATFLTPQMRNAILQGPPWLHLETWSGWLLIAVTPSNPAGAGAELVQLTQWARWFAELLPLDQLEAPPPPTT